MYRIKYPTLVVCKKEKDEVDKNIMCIHNRYSQFIHLYVCAIIICSIVILVFLMCIYIYIHMHIYIGSINIYIYTYTYITCFWGRRMLPIKPYDDHGPIQCPKKTQQRQGENAETDPQEEEARAKFLP